MIRRTMMVLAAGMMMVQAATGLAQLKDGETIVFLGDSITQAGAGENGYATLFRQSVEASRLASCALAILAAQHTPSKYAR